MHELLCCWPNFVCFEGQGEVCLIDYKALKRLNLTGKRTRFQQRRAVGEDLHELALV